MKVLQNFDLKCGSEPEKREVHMWFLIPYFKLDPKVNTYGTCLPHRLIDWLTD